MQTCPECGVVFARDLCPLCPTIAALLKTAAVVTQGA